MEFADEGGEGADAVRGAAARRHGRGQHALHPAGRGRGDLAGHAAAARRATARAHVRPRELGARRGRPADRRVRRLARALGRGVVNAPTTQSAAAPSPFPPIADYAFLSDCHTGALIAPDGAVDWLCVPRFDSPSVFGTLLDRQAGYFRFGPFGINHPTARVYEPGTNVLTTTWKTPSGWIEVRDALTIGPRTGEDEVTPHTRPPADDDADHMLVRTVRLPGRQRRGGAGLRAGLRLRAARRPTWSLVGRRPACRRRERRRPDDPAADRPRARHRGQPGPRPARAVSRRRVLLRAVVGGRAGRARRRRRGQQPSGRDDAVLAGLAGPGQDARPPLARPAPAFRSGHQGPHLHADRGHRGRPDHLPAGDAGRRAQLGLPLHAGCATAPSRCRRCTS